MRDPKFPLRNPKFCPGSPKNPPGGPKNAPRWAPQMPRIGRHKCPALGAKGGVACEVNQSESSSLATPHTGAGKGAWSTRR